LGIPEEKMVNLYAMMLKIRRFEEKIVELLTQRGKRMLAHLYIGEEAVAAGVCANLRKSDYITSTHRGHGHCLAKGTQPKYMMAELFGKRTGTNKGKGGSMHIAEHDIGNLGANGIVAASIPIAVGAGLSIKMRGTDQVCVCFFGDGASNQGPFHEGLNLAAIWKLPVIFVCENNQYGMFVPVSYSVPIENISDRAAAYGIPGVTVDGMDALSVYEGAQAAIARAREGLGPTLLECKTYRFMGHTGPYEIEPFGKGVSPYRTRDEIAKWKARDPIHTLRTKLIAKGILTESDADEIDKETMAEMEEAVTFAEESPDPKPEEALEDLFA
jgi:TPP-dependent pyruvate/acetoin dehydrogenase alpha subunit